MGSTNSIIGLDDRILLTGASGFIGAKVLEELQQRGFRNVRCLVRNSTKVARLHEGSGSTAGPKVEFFQGDLLAKGDCKAAVRDVSVIYHLAAGTGTKSFADAFMNSVVTTRNLLDAALEQGCLRRFVNVSSFAVYSNRKKPESGVLDESCPTEEHAELRADPYCFAKLKQDEIVTRYGEKHGIPYVLVRPGVVYGPGKERIHGRVGLNTFGIFLHLGGSNPIPLTYVDNCAEALVLAGITPGMEGEVFNVVDDELPSSRKFLRMYKSEVRRFQSIYVPRLASYLLCLLWEKYSSWSSGQLPPVYNRRAWAAYWKRTAYSNGKIKRMLRWKPKISTGEGLKRYFAGCRKEITNA
jgi:nucleoside-diphosphate-sugar epimerase